MTFTTVVANEALDIEQTVRALEEELDNMDNSVQREGVGVEDINSLPEDSQKEVDESEVQVTDEVADDENGDDSDTESKKEASDDESEEKKQ